MDLEALVASRTAERDEMEKQLEAQAKEFHAYKHHVEYSIRAALERIVTGGEEACVCGECVVVRLLSELGFSA